MNKRINRREFLGAAGAAGLAAGLAGKAAGFSSDSQPATLKPETNPFPEPEPTQGQTTMAGLAAPKLEKVRVGFIGVGARGSGHVAQMLQLDGVEVVAISDLYQDWADRSAKTCTDKGRAKPTLYVNGKDEYKKMLDRNDIDIVIISTPWEDHVRMAVDAMNRGKHAFIEVPAAVTMDECWKMVDTSEKTRKHCMMMENCCYGREELMVLNMAQLGVFGELLHGEAAYIHDLRGQMNEVERGTGSWRTYHYIKRNGNVYPTHGLGPVCQYLGVNRGDRMDYLSSVSSNSRVRTEYAKAHFPPDHKWNKSKFICGDINTTIVKTVNGRTIMIQWDEQLPRPYSRLNLLQGTKGTWGGYPERATIDGLTKSTESWASHDSFKQLKVVRDDRKSVYERQDELAPIYEKYDHPLYTKVKNLPGNLGGHGDMDFIMLWRMVYCLRNGLALDQDVYDAATWSSISPLSEYSVAHRGRSMDVPDFTRGAWKAMKPIGIVS